MKNFNPLRYAATFALFVFLFSSCSKDSLSRPQPGSRNSTSNTTPSDPVPADQTGIIQALVYPPDYTISLVASNPDYTSAETFADKNGFVEILDVPVGVYTVVAHAYPDPNATTDIPDIIINDVKVSAGEITDLGKIVFQ